MTRDGSADESGRAPNARYQSDSERTSPYKFYQFWLNVDERDAGRYLRYVLLLSREEIEELERASSVERRSR